MKHFIIFVISLLVVFSAVLFSVEKEYSGNGEAILGSGTTMEQVEQIALLLSKRDALDKYGVYVEGSSLVENYELTKDEIYTLSAGIVKLKQGSKKVKKIYNNDVFKIKVIATFIIDDELLKIKINNYLQQKENNSYIEKYIYRLKKLENQIQKLSNENAKYEDVKETLDETEKSYDEFSKQVSGIGLFNKALSEIDKKNQQKKVISDLAEYVARNLYIIKLDKPEIVSTDPKKKTSNIRVPINISFNYNTIKKLAHTFQNINEGDRKFNIIFRHKKNLKTDRSITVLCYKETSFLWWQNRAYNYYPRKGRIWGFFQWTVFATIYDIDNFAIKTDEINIGKRDDKSYGNPEAILKSKDYLEFNSIDIETVKSINEIRVTEKRGYYIDDDKKKFFIIK